MERIYLDNAATSFPKPESVYDAMDSYNRNLGAAVGRSGYDAALDVQRTVEHCRKRAAMLLGAESSDRIVFTFNATDSLNLAIHGLLNSGDHVVTSGIEHNSVLRPLRALRDRSQINVSYVPAGLAGHIDPADVRAAIRPETRLIALTHASNVTGAIQPIDEVGAVARSNGIPFLVDAAQTAGHCPIDLASQPIDLLACAGHKGLLGPLGTGLLYVCPGLEDRLRTVRQGGTGSLSEDDRQPTAMPDRYESGNHNAPGLFGLDAALEWIERTRIATIERQQHELMGRLIEGLSAIDALTIHGPSAGADRVSVVSLSVREFEPQEFATILDQSFGIQVRAGLHCAPGAHRSLGTLASGGTVRISSGPFTTSDEIDACITAVRDITGQS